jgi:4-hydroxyphenylpyruvate dioxygenase-like putative hemolysin
VVKDADRAANYFSSILGLGPFKSLILPSYSATIRGKPANYKLKILLADLGRVELEIVEVLEGETIHKEFLEARGEGLHHIGLFVKDIEKEIERWKKRGINILQIGRDPPPAPEDAYYAYMDTTQTAGVIIELLSNTLLDD